MRETTLSVLIADGRAYSRSAMRLLLGQEPWVVVVGEAASVDAAVAAIARCRPDVVLFDWELLRHVPDESLGQSGDSALDDLRTVSPDVFVVALSGRPEARREALAAGADAFVSKGDPPERLVAALAGCRGSGRGRSGDRMRDTEVD